MRPRDSFCFLLVSSHFFYPKFKRGSCNSKYEYHSTTQSIAEPLPSSRQSHSQNDPKTQGHGRRRWSRPPWPSQRSAARPRWPRRSQPPNAAPSCLGAEDARRSVAAAVEKHSCFSRWLGAEDATRTAGLLRLPSRNKAYSHGMFLQAVGQNSEYRSQISDPPSILFVCFSVRHGENKSSNHRNICSCSIVLFKPYQQLHLAYFRSIMRRVSRNYFMKNVGLSKCG